MQTEGIPVDLNLQNSMLDNREFISLTQKTDGELLPKSQNDMKRPKILKPWRVNNLHFY